MEYQIKFRGIDNWSRPIYKVIDKPMYFGSTDTLFKDEVEEEKVNEHFRENTKELEYFGNKFGCEPHGGRPDNLILTII
jgi:hypothetical protein